MARRVCSEGRVWIEVLSDEGLSDAVITARLWAGTGRRCGGRGGAVGPAAYCDRRARVDADVRATRPRASRLAADTELCRQVQQRLDERLSPHAISAELAQCGFRVCAETVYQACYDRSGRSGLKPGTWNKLPRARRRRKPRSRCEEAKRSALGDYKPIADRPETAADRQEPGHWEGDLITGKNNQTAVATLVERTSRHTLAVPLCVGYDAPSTAKAVTAALARQPAGMVKTLTWDQGTEMARWADIEESAGIEVYSCEPQSPWQQPANEQTNGLLRRWPPKSTGLDIGAARLAVIEDRINNMPRKLHHWNTAQTIYDDLRRDPQ